jgi:hypothetical protein
MVTAFKPFRLGVLSDASFVHAMHRLLRFHLCRNWFYSIKIQQQKKTPEIPCWGISGA